MFKKTEKSRETPIYGSGDKSTIRLLERRY